MSSSGPPYPGNTDSEKIANQIHSWLLQTDFEAAGASEVNRKIEGFDLLAQVDSTLSASANWEIIKERLDLNTKGEFEEQLKAWEDAEIDHLRAEIRGQLEEYGIETVADALADNPGVPPALQGRVDDVLDEYPPDVYDAEIRNQVGNVFDVLGDDFRVIESHRLEDLRREAERVADTGEAEERVLEAFRQSFGQQFDDVQDAIRSLQERIASARGERLRIAPIEVRRSGDSFLIRVEDGEDFEPFRQPARRRIEQELDLSELGRTWTTVGEVRLRGDDLEALDLEVGRERLGGVSAPQPLEIELREEAGQQADIGDVTASVLADQFIELGEGGES